MKSFASSLVNATRRSLLVLSPWFFVVGPSFVLSPGSLASGRGTKDQARTTDQAPSTKDQPWFGTWQQVPPSKSWFDPWPYQNVTLRIEPSDDGLHVVYDMVRRRGGIQHMEWSGRFDGREYPVQGVDYVLTNAYRRLSDRSYEIVVRLDGRQAAVATAVVSPDGRTLNVETTERDAKGRSVTTTARYQKY